MANVKFMHNQYKADKKATVVSWIGGLLSTLILIPGIYDLVRSCIAMYHNGFTKLESWKTMGWGVLSLVACLLVSTLVNRLFEKIAMRVAKAKREKELKKRGINV